jgi:sulfur-carrier protein
MADVRLPTTLAPLFPGMPRKLDVQAATVSDVIDHLERDWPGIRDRLCEPGPTLRPHIHVYVNSERAEIDTPVREQSRVDVIAAISGGSASSVGPA